MAKRKNAIRGELTEGQISWLIFGDDLLTGIPSPFADESAAMECYRENEKYLLGLFHGRRGKDEFPTRYYESRGMERPRLGHPLTSRALMPEVLRKKLGLGERKITTVSQPRTVPEPFGKIASA